MWSIYGKCHHFMFVRNFICNMYFVQCTYFYQQNFCSKLTMYIIKLKMCSSRPFLEYVFFILNILIFKALMFINVIVWSCGRSINMGQRNAKNKNDSSFLMAKKESCITITSSLLYLIGHSWKSSQCVCSTL